YRPQLELGVLRSVVIVVTDRTDLVLRERSDLVQRDLVAATAAILRDRRAFGRFVAEGGRLVARLCDPEDPGDRRALAILTDEAAVHGLTGLARSCRELDQEWAD